MIVVEHEKTTKEKFGLIELDLYFHGREICLKVDPNESDETIECLQRTANDRIRQDLPNVFH